MRRCWYEPSNPERGTAAQNTTSLRDCRGGIHARCAKKHPYLHLDVESLRGEFRKTLLMMRNEGMTCSVFPLNPCGLTGEVTPYRTVRFIGHRIATWFAISRRHHGVRRLWSGRYHPG